MLANTHYAKTITVPHYLLDEQGGKMGHDYAYFLSMSHIELKIKKKEFTRKQIFETMTNFHVACCLFDGEAHTDEGSFGINFEKVRPFDKQLTNVQTYPLKKYGNYYPTEDDYKKVFELVDIVRASGYYLSNHFDLNYLAIFKPLIVEIDNHSWQVNAVVFQMSDSVCVFYELVDCLTGRPLGHDKLYGSQNVPFAWQVDSFAYNDMLGTADFYYSEEYLTVNDIVMSDYLRFLFSITNSKKTRKKFSTQYGIYVVTEEKINAKDFFTKVAGDEKINYQPKDLSTVTPIEYYSSSQLGLVLVKDNSIFPTVVIDFLMYEILKLYMLCHIAELTRDQSDKDIVKKKQLLLEDELFQIDNFHQTYGVIDNIRNLDEYKRINNAIDNKIELKKLETAIKTETYSGWLNWLILTLSFFSAIGAIPLLSRNSGLTEICLLTIAIVLFMLFAGVILYQLYWKRH